MKFNKRNYKALFNASFETPEMLQDIKKELTFTSTPPKQKDRTYFRLSFQLVTAFVLTFITIHRAATYSNLGLFDYPLHEMDIIIILLSFLLLGMTLVESFYRFTQYLKNNKTTK